MPASDFDFIIIGQGLAGSILAYHLIEQQQRILVIDNEHVGSASNVAAGIINPITGHRLNISDRFNEFYPIAKAFYQAVEEHLTESFNHPFFQPLKQTRLIKNEGQKHYLEQRKGESAYDELLGDNPDNAFGKSALETIEIKQSAAVDAKSLLTALKTYFIEKQAYLSSKIEYQDINQTTSTLSLAGVSAKHVIFCEGYQAIHNPWLEHLPFKLAKGEILTVQTTPCFENTLLNWGNWLVNSNGVTKLGSNFIWNDLSLMPNQSNKEKLLLNLHENTLIQAKVITHEVGIRPTTTQRIPFIGPIKNLPNAYCFNGFGSKGCLLIPFYAQLLSQHFLNARTLPEELTQWI